MFMGAMTGRNRQPKATGEFETRLHGALARTISNVALLITAVAWLSACDRVPVPLTTPKIDPKPAILENRAPAVAPPDMVWIPGGTFWMGANDPESEDAKPVHLVTLDGFWMDQTEVTNAQFAAFVKATSYMTFAEKAPNPKDYPGVPAGKLVAGSAVFKPPAGPVSLADPLVWWDYVPGASWKHPEGPSSTIEGHDSDPAVQISYEDALAYCQWAGKRLPTEAEWEFAARGGLDRKRFTWGDETLPPDGKWPANNWQGSFPAENTAVDGFKRVAPAASFAPNGFGLYDMSGNVWEWCSDWYQPGYEVTGAEPLRNPQGPDSSNDPMEPGIPKRVHRGGSFLCGDMYCRRYLPGARGKGAVDSPASNLGFRCVRSPEKATYPEPRILEKSR